MFATYSQVVQEKNNVHVCVYGCLYTHYQGRERREVTANVIKYQLGYLSEGHLGMFCAMFVTFL